jgi:hypothetical protein
MKMKKIALMLTTMVGVLISALLTSACATAADITPSNPGSWTVVANCPGINPIHAAMLPSGNILMMAGSGYNRENADMKINQAWIYNTSTPGTCPQEIPLPEGKDLFCAGMTHLPDGRILVFGGTGRYGASGSYLGSPDYYTGIKEAFVYSEESNQFTPVPDMAVARWYGTGLTRSDGNIVVFGGLDENSDWTQNHQLFNASALTWSNIPTPPWKMPMYAGSVILPNGLAAYTGTYFGNRNGNLPMAWNVATNASTPIPGLQYPDCRDQANTLVMYPKVYVIGGGCKVGLTSSVNVMDMSQSPLQFTSGGFTGQAGMHQCGAVLPDKSLFISHGTDHNKNPKLGAKRLLPDQTTWQTMASPSVARGYHSTCMVLKDGRVLTMGTNWNGGIVETKLEVYNPWYTQPGFARPTLTGLGLTTTSCGTTTLKAGTRVKATYGVASPVSATLTRLPSVTHQHDANNRVVPLEITKTGSGTLEFTAPPASAKTPKGIYMLSLLDWRGAPTASKMVSIGGTDCCC